MELKLEAFGQYLIETVNSESIENKLFGIAILENGELTEAHILEEDFNKYEHIILDDYPNSEEILNKIKEKNISFPIVVLK
jgi:hypothetical protein